jgi:hypothetical protein
MDSATVGLIGAVGGAVLAGGTKILQDTLARRLASRTAARLLTVALQEVWVDASSILGVDQYRNITARWDRQGSAWTTHQEALARVIGPDDFEAVATAFSSTHLMQQVLIAVDSSERPGSVGGFSYHRLTRIQRPALEQLLEQLEDGLAALNGARYSVTEKTRAWVDLDQAPPRGLGKPDSAGPLDGPGR